MTNRIIALDADGVLLDYGLAYAGAWRKAFGVYPRERDPNAYWPIDRWEVERLEDDGRLDQFRRAFDGDFWASIPPIRGAVEACRSLHAAGYELVCVTALPDEYRVARERNLRLHGFPIELVHATENTKGPVSPKAATLNTIKPAVFVDDYLPYFIGVSSDVHRALVLRRATGSPNSGKLLVHTDSQHSDLAEFAQWWLTRTQHQGERGLQTKSRMIPQISPVVTLYRPTGPEELELVRSSGYTKWPPRLPEQPIFYPVTNEQYAIEIARDWNVKASGSGYVTRFQVRKEFMDRYRVEQVGAAHHTEWWIPAEDLDELNQNIVGHIEVIREFHA